ncbi:Pkinase-domain-containing protein [Auriscalpium vulgare]|uniref:Pkinase-domain-containing protein n=1 Tax=Auriscalpium vulgare TaxID=40419 RepID=A0ACB8RYL1_9AGAM|nr:Pkinase-domain-containing protein [Auriscalpium vulgare]
MVPSIAPPAQKASSGASFGQQPDGEELRPYVLTGDLGQGSFATVYKGYNEETRQEVAVKTVNHSTLSSKLLQNLQSEIDILKSLSHRHITRLFDIIRAERNIYLIMEYCSGGDLAHYIKKRGRVDNLEYIPEPGAAPQYYPHPRTGGLAEIVVRSFLRQLARALRFLRQRNLIHRDIKPQNLLLKPATEEELGRGHPLGGPILKMADFGFARSLPNATMAETICGTPLYMAPEVMNSKHDAKADLWSVGAVLYEMSVGRPPFRAANHIDLFKKIGRSKGIKFPDEDSAASPDAVSVPADVKELIRMLLRRNPVERASYEDFFKSTAMVNSKFTHPVPPAELLPQHPAEDDAVGGLQDIPRHLIQVPPEVLDPRVMIPPSKFNFRKHKSSPSSQSEVPLSASLRSAMPDIRPPVRVAPTGKPPADTRPVLRPLSTELEGSIIPGETEEDGLLRQEYVFVGDTDTVEFNEAVDEINASRRRPLLDRRVPPTPIVLEKERSDFASSESPQSASTNVTFPPHPKPQSISPPAMPHRSASNALSRALTLASEKLFGVTSVSPHSDESSPSPLPPSPRRAQIMAARREGDGDGEEGRGRDPVEDDLLAALEQLAQKTHVITRWADEMYAYVKAIPEKPLPDPSKFTPLEGEPEKLATRRRNADMQAEYNAVTCVAIYLLVMSFSQNGIDELRKYQEHMEMRHPDEDFVASEGFDEALMWFKEHFLKCNDRTALVKTWLPAEYTGPSTWVDELVYNRALTLSRTAARKELLNQHKSPDECERLYEESLWCLYALQDDLLQRGDPFMEEDRNTIFTWIKRTKLRLIRCRARMSMNQRDRLLNARADQNLHDVTVIAPWDADTPGQFQDEEGGMTSPISS